MPFSEYELEIGCGLVNYAYEIGELIKTYRKEYCADFPKIHLRDNSGMETMQYRFSIKGKVVVDKQLASNEDVNLNKLMDEVIAAYKKNAKNEKSVI